VHLRFALSCIWRAAAPAPGRRFPDPRFYAFTLLRGVPPQNSDSSGVACLSGR